MRKLEAHRKGTGKSLFPQKLWRLVNDTRLSSAVRWSDDGQSFFVHENPLKDMCLGKENKVFYTSEPKSFIRQLHLYGFRKIDKNQFTHRCFQKGRPDLIPFIRRAYKPNRSSTSSDDTINFEAQQPQSTKSIEPTTPSSESTIKNNSATHSSNFQESGFLATGAAALVTPCSLDAFANEEDYEVTSLAPLSTDWFENNNHNDDSLMTLYNNDVYPNTDDDNNITFCSWCL